MPHQDIFIIAQSPIFRNGGFLQEPAAPFGHNAKSGGWEGFIPRALSLFSIAAQRLVLAKLLPF